MVTYVGRTRTNLDCAFPLETVIVSCQNIKDTDGVVVVCRPFMFNCKLVKLVWQVFSCNLKKWVSFLLRGRMKVEAHVSQ